MNHLVKSHLSKKITVANIASYVIIFLLVVPLLTGCSVQRINRLKNKSYKEWKIHQWTAIKSSPDTDLAEWTISSRKVKETNLFEYKIEGSIASSPAACVAAFRDKIHLNAIDNNSKKYPVYEIVRECVDSLLTYVIHNEPLPFRDTEMRVQYVFIKNEDGSMGVAWNEAWHEDSAPSSKKLKRVETFRGSWMFSSVFQNKSKAVNIVQFNPKGMPKWLVNPMVIRFLRNGLENIRSATSNKNCKSF